MAHPERYGFMTFEDLQTYKTRSLSLQLNLLSLLGYYGPLAKAMAEKLIENNMVDYVGTDCHNLINPLYILSALLTNIGKC